MAFFLNFGVMVGFLSHAPHSLAQTIATATPDSRPELLTQIQILRDIEPYVEKIDLPRLRNLQAALADALQKLSTLGIVNRESIQAIQRVVLVYRYSESYLKSISSQLIAPQILRINALIQVLSKRHGFDEVQGSNLIEIMTKQMATLVEQLLKNSEDSELTRDLSALKIKIGEAQAVAELGDRPRAFRAGDQAYHSLTLLYSRLFGIQVSDNSFNTARELIELNEFYGHYSQIGLKPDSESGVRP